MKIFIFSVVFSLILVTIFRFGFKENRNIGKGVTFKKPEAFTKDQKLTLSLMMIMMVVVLIFPLLQVLMPGNAAIKYVSSKVDVGSGSHYFRSDRTASEAGSTERSNRKNPMEYHCDDRRSRYADRCSRRGRIPSRHYLPGSVLMYRNHWYRSHSVSLARS